MEPPRPAGSPREEEKEEEEEEGGGAGPGSETLPRDPRHPPASFSWDTVRDRVAMAFLTLVSFCSEVPSFLRSRSPAQKASASSPPLAQTQAMQENETPNEENPQPNEQLQDSEYVKVKDFTIQVRVTGRTGDCEKDFLKEVADHLWKHEIHLKVEDYQEDSGHFLLVFCPVASRVGTDMQNALEDLQGEPKAVLVMLHHRPKEYDHFLDTKLQAQHPAVVRTVHARYTLEDGLYDCQVNEEAVAAVAEVLKDHLQKEQKEPATPGPTMDSGDQMCSNSTQESND